jgi:putative PIN family toxin of toxin-antitoxin system
LLRLRYALATNVLVAALRSDRGASKLLARPALDRDVELLLSVPLMIEYEPVLNRTENLAAFGITSDEVRDILDELTRIAMAVKLTYRLCPRLRDANDDMVLETALNGGADSIVTFNRSDFAVIEPVLRCDVLTPGESLRRLRGGRK